MVDLNPEGIPFSFWSWSQGQFDAQWPLAWHKDDPRGFKRSNLCRYIIPLSTFISKMHESCLDQLPQEFHFSVIMANRDV